MVARRPAGVAGTGASSWSNSLRSSQRPSQDGQRSTTMPWYCCSATRSAWQWGHFIAPSFQRRIRAQHSTGLAQNSRMWPHPHLRQPLSTLHYDSGERGKLEVRELGELRQIEEPPRKTPVMAETDVLVIGGGPGVLSAALAAAREGVDTMLVERYGCFGGVITQSMIGTIAWYRSKPETVDAGGIGVEFEQRAKEAGAGPTIFLSEILDTEVFKHIADQMLHEAGVVPLLH